MRFESNFETAGTTIRNYELFARAWDECIELQVTPKDEWTSRSILALQSIDRYEICIWHEGCVIGGIILGHDAWDMHVGTCLSVFAQYVLPEFRNQSMSLRFMLEARKIAKELDYKTLAYTHRKGPWEYATLYKRV